MNESVSNARNAKELIQPELWNDNFCWIPVNLDSFCFGLDGKPTRYTFHIKRYPTWKIKKIGS